MKLEECINYLLTGAQHMVFSEMKNELKVVDLTPVQYGVLKCLWEKHMSSPKEIADCMGIENSTISGILERMEKKGLIRREIDENDRRYIKISLTDASRRLEKPVDEIVENVNKVVLEPFTEEEIKNLKNYLSRL